LRIQRHYATKDRIARIFRFLLIGEACVGATQNTFTPRSLMTGRKSLREIGFSN
jgi:hypothetical protein